MPASILNVTIPSTAEAIRVVRAVANAAAAAEEFSYDGLGDIDLAVGEAGAALLDLSAEGDIGCAITPTAGALQFEMSLVTPGLLGDWPPEDWPESLGAIVLNAVAGDVMYVLDEGRPTIRFTVSRS